MDILGSSLSNLRYKNLETLDKAEQETLEKEFSSLMWSEVLKSLEQCDEVLQSELSRSSHSQLTSLKYQMLAQKMGDQYPLDFSSIFPKEKNESSDLNALTDARVPTLRTDKEVQQKNLSLNDDSLLLSEDHLKGEVINFDTPEDFVEYLLPEIRAINPNEEAVPSEAVLAQAALETGWGKKVLGHEQDNPSYNLFNIKATPDRWQGDKIVKNAIEVIDGSVEKIKSSFRSYANYTESIKDYFDFIAQGRYKDILDSNNTANSFIDKIASKGYATDPQYAEKLNRVVGTIRNLLQKGTIS